MRLASLVIGMASDEIVEKGKRIAGHLMETAPVDIEFVRGNFTVKGTDRRIGIFDVAKAAATRTDLPEELRGKLDAVGDQTVVGRRLSLGHACLRGRGRSRYRTACASCAGPGSTMSGSRSIR